MLTSYVSKDDGMTWSKGLLLDEREGVSYPDGIQSPDGTIYVAYDYQRRAAKQILMAAFAEEDAIRSDSPSSKLRLRVPVNQAFGT